MKAFTDIKQSKQLADILPIESADMWWNFYSVITNTTPLIIHLEKPWIGNFNWNNESDNIPAWSLAALLDRIPSDIKSNDGSLYTLDIEKCDAEPYPCGLSYHDTWGRSEDICTHYYDNFVDACVEMIVKLKEKGLI